MFGMISICVSFVCVWLFRIYHHRMNLLMMAIESLDGCDFANIGAAVHVKRINGDLVVVANSLIDERRYKFDRNYSLENFN